MTEDSYAPAEAEAAGWRVAPDALSKTFRFAAFADAIAFMARCAPAIDALDHHPEWSNVYDRVEVRLISHDAGRVTTRDFRLARLLDDKAHGVG